MKRILPLMVSLIMLPLISSCGESKAEKEARLERERQEQIRIEKEKEEAELKAYQERIERERQEKIEKERKLKEKFVGTYKFDYYNNDGSYWYCPPIIVLEDGRAIKIESESLDGRKDIIFIGNIEPISEDAFILSRYKEFSLPVNTYKNGRKTGYTTYQHKWNSPGRKPVFDLKEGKLYFKSDDYKNRDITEAEYTYMSHNSSTSY